MNPPPAKITGGLVAEVAPESLAAKMGVQVGDVLLKVNDYLVEDVIDVQYYAAEYTVSLTLRRGDREIVLEGQRDEWQPLGIEFANPTFDIDIRRCNNLCEFCFVLQMSPRFRRTLYIKDDDYRYSFLQGHFVTLTNLTPRDEERIIEQHLSPLYISVHATDLQVRRAVLRNDSAPDIIEQLRWLTEAGIEIHTQIVVTPGLNDGEYLEQSITDLAQFYPDVASVSIVPVGLTRHHKYGRRPNTREEAEVVLDVCEKWRDEFQAQFGVNFIYPTDEWYLVTERPIPPLKTYDDLELQENGLGMVRHFLDEWALSQKELTAASQIKSLTLATGVLFAPTLKKYAAEFTALSKVKTEVIPITNTQLGETITVSGLLMGRDIINRLKDHELGEMVVLPRVTFDHPDQISLDDVSPQEIADALGKPVVLVDLMGDLVDAIYGQAGIIFTPS